MINREWGELQLLAIFWLAHYVALAGVYLAVGSVVERRNAKLEAGLRIQPQAEVAGLRSREIKKSLQSLVTIAGFVGAGLWAQWVGLTLWQGASYPWWSLPPLLLLSMVVYDAWFYWGHRLVHAKRLYRRVHAWHHRARAPIVWSNNSDTFLDNLFLQSYFLVAALVLPLPAAVLIVHKLIDQVVGMIGHSGYEHSAGPLSRAPSPFPGVTFHDQHHRDLRYNFGTHFTVWDRLMNTVHPDYDQRIVEFEVAARCSTSVPMAAPTGRGERSGLSSSL